MGNARHSTQTAPEGGDTVSKESPPTPFDPRTEILSAAMTQLRARRWRFVEAALDRLKEAPDTQRRTAIPVLSLSKGPGRLNGLEAPEDGQECPSYASAALPLGVLAQAYRGLGRYARAADVLDESIKQHESELPDDLPDPELEKALAQDHFDLVCNRAASMDLAKAEQALERAGPYLEDDDRAANARYLLGLETLRSRKNPTRAAYHFRQVITRFPNSHWAEKASFYLAQVGAQ